MTTTKQAEARGRLIAAARKKKGLSQDQIAEYCDVSRAAVSEWENGKVLDLQPEKAFILSGLLSIPRENLVSGFVLKQIEDGETNPDNLVVPIRGLVSSEAEHIALVWDRIDPSDPVRNLIAEVIDRIAVISPRRNHS